MGLLRTHCLPEPKPVTAPSPTIRETKRFDQQWLSIACIWHMESCYQRMDIRGPSVCMFRQDGHREGQGIYHHDQQKALLQPMRRWAGLRRSPPVSSWHDRMLDQLRASAVPFDSSRWAVLLPSEARLNIESSRSSNGA